MILTLGQVIEIYKTLLIEAGDATRVGDFDNFHWCLAEARRLRAEIHTRFAIQ